jgi:hypothetical protein
VAESRAQGEHAARQAASALYHVSTAIAMAWEAGRLDCPRRMRLAQLVLKHRVLPHDPLALGDEPAWLDEVLDPTPTTQRPVALNDITAV